MSKKGHFVLSWWRNIFTASESSSANTRWDGKGGGGQSRDQVALKKKPGLALFQVMVMAICETCDRGSEGCRLGRSICVMDATLMAENARRHERRP